MSTASARLIPTIEALIARCLTEPDLLESAIKNPTAFSDQVEATLRQEAQQFNFRKLQSFSAFITKVQHNYLWEYFRPHVNCCGGLALNMTYLVNIREHNYCRCQAFRTESCAFGVSVNSLRRTSRNRGNGCCTAFSRTSDFCGSYATVRRLRSILRQTKSVPHGIGGSLAVRFRPSHPTFGLLPLTTTRFV